MSIFLPLVPLFSVHSAKNKAAPCPRSCSPLHPHLPGTSPRHPMWLQPNEYHRVLSPRWPFCYCLSGLCQEGSPWNWGEEGGMMPPNKHYCYPRGRSSAQGVSLAATRHRSVLFCSCCGQVYLESQGPSYPSLPGDTLGEAHLVYLGPGVPTFLGPKGDWLGLRILTSLPCSPQGLSSILHRD